MQRQRCHYKFFKNAQSQAKCNYPTLVEEWEYLIFKRNNTYIHSVKALRAFDGWCRLGTHVDPTHAGMFIEVTKEVKWRLGGPHAYMIPDANFGKNGWVKDRARSEMIDD